MRATRTFCQVRLLPLPVKATGQRRGASGVSASSEQPLENGVVLLAMERFPMIA